MHIRVLFCWVNGLDLLSHKVYVTELDKVVVPYCSPTSSMWEFQRLHTSHFHSCPLVCLCHNSGLSKSGHWLLCFSPPVDSHWSQHEMHGVLGLIWFVPVAFPTSCPLYSSTPSCPALVASFLPLSPSSSVRDFADVVLLGRLLIFMWLPSFNLRFVSEMSPPWAAFSLGKLK